MSEYILESFYNYLMNIGMIDIDSVNQLNEIFQDIINQDSNIDFQSAMSSSLIFFLNNMAEYQQKYFSINLIIKFFEKFLEEKLAKLKNIFYITSKITTLYMYKYFLKWKNTTLDKLNCKIYKSNSLLPLYKTNSLKKQNKSFSSKNNLEETSWIKKEKESLSHCTFNPNINKSKNRFNSQPNIKSEISVFDRLYQYNQKYFVKKQLKQVEYENIKNAQLTFQPFKSVNYNNNNNGKLNNNLNFEERQKTFLESKKNHKDRIENEINDDFNRECYFNPKIHKMEKLKKMEILKNGYEINIPAYKRLYNDVKRRRNQNKKIIDEYNMKINERCNSIQHSNSCVDYNKIDELYNQYKTKNEKRQKIKEKLEFEEGITFHPYVNKNNNYYNKIKNDFFERNNQSLYNKNKFIEDYINKEEEKLIQSKIENKKNRKYSQIEKEKITKRIIERLYRENKTLNNNNNYEDEEQKNSVEKNNTNYF